MRLEYWKRLLIVIVALAMIAAACGDDDDDTTAGDDAAADDAAADDAAADDAATDDAAADDGAADDAGDDAMDDAGDDAMDDVSLVGICPDPLIVQTDWFPEPEHGFTYQLIGPDGELDAENGIYSGPLGDTGINMEIRAGGPYVGFSPPNAQIYADDSIFMGYASTAEAIQNSGALPVIAVFTFFDVGPQILMWDPEDYTFSSFEDIGESGAPVLYFEGGAYMDYFLGEGILNADQVDASYDGSPTRFTTEDGIVQQGFATNEPWRYENEIESWLKPVDFLLIHDADFPNSQSALSVRPESIEEDRECLEKLVPMFQQATLDYLADPEPVNVRLNQIVTDLASFWTASEESHAAGTQAMLDLELVTDGDNGYVGDMDPERIQRMIDIMLPIYLDRGDDNVNPEVTPEDIFTNEFLDTSISLGF